jgi:hypothetical protein
MTVEFVADGGDVVAVHIANSEGHNLNRNNAEDIAKVMLVQVANFGPDEVTVKDDIGAVSHASTAPPDAESMESPAAISLRSVRAAQDTGTLEEHLQEGLESSFPASDPVSASANTISGGGATYPSSQQVN